MESILEEGMAGKKWDWMEELGCCRLQALLQAMDNALLNNQLILYNSCLCCAPFLNDCVNISRQRSEIYLICRLLFPQPPAGTV